MRLRKIIFWMHLTAGLIAGSVVLVMSVTGVLLAFERQLTEWADRDLRVIPPAPGAPRLSIGALISGIRAAEPEAMLSGLTVRSDPAAPAAISLGRERTVFLNPYSGVLAEGSRQPREFFRSVTNVHRWLGTPEESRPVGRSITGACNLAFLFLVISGFYLWWPRQWTKSAGRAIVFFNVRLRGKVRDFNWHNATGFWCAPVLFCIVLSGVLLSYSWATNLLYLLTGSEPPPSRAASGRRPGPPKESSFIPDDIDRLWTIAEQRVPDWKTISVRFGTSPSTPLTFSIEQGYRGRPDLRSQLTLDSKTGEVVHWEPFASLSPGRQLRTWARFVHTGEAGGALGQTIAAFASAGAALLVCTGFALAWRRFRERKRRSQPIRVSESAEVLS